MATGKGKKSGSQSKAVSIKQAPPKCVFSLLHGVPAAARQSDNFTWDVSNNPKCFLHDAGKEAVQQSRWKSPNHETRRCARATFRAGVSLAKCIGGAELKKDQCSGGKGEWRPGRKGCASCTEKAAEQSGQGQRGGSQEGRSETAERRCRTCISCT